MMPSSIRPICLLRYLILPLLAQSNSTDRAVIEQTIATVISKSLSNGKVIGFPSGWEYDDLNQV